MDFMVVSLICEPGFYLGDFVWGKGVTFFINRKVLKSFFLCTLLGRPMYLLSDHLHQYISHYFFSVSCISFMRPKSVSLPNGEPSGSSMRYGRQKSTFQHDFKNLQYFTGS